MSLPQYHDIYHVPNREGVLIVPLRSTKTRSDFNDARDLALLAIGLRRPFTIEQPECRALASLTVHHQ